MFNRYCSAKAHGLGVCLVLVTLLVVASSAAAIDYPFSDNMENPNSGNWAFTSPWGYTTEAFHSDTMCITDSPGTLYENDVNISVTLSQNLNLTSAVKPVLRFWEKYQLETNGDYGYVDVSGDGGSNWKTIYYVTGFQNTWREDRVDLTEYAGKSDVRVRFRLQTNYSVRYDGWYIDDVCIEETSTPNLAYQFYDDMEGGSQTEANWHSSSWELTTSDYHSAGHCWDSNPTGTGGNYSDSWLTSSGTIDLSNAVCPRLVFWHRFLGSYFSVQVSTDGGQTWTTLAQYSYSSSLTPWSRVDLDLTNYLSPVFRLRFLAYSYSGPPRWLIDDVEVREGACRLADWCLLESPDSTVAMAGTPTDTIYGQVSESGITNPPGQGQGIVAQLGYGPDGTLPSGNGWTWVSATYDSDVENKDRYKGTLTVTSEGTYDFAYRFLVVGQDSSWTYADLDGNDLGSGGSNGYSAAKAGHLVVTALCDISVSPESLHWCLLPGDSASSFLAIVNTGNGTLTFQIMESQESQAKYGEQADSLLIPLWDIPWLREEPTSGTVAPGDTVFVQVFVNAPASPDTVGSHLVVLSNDPDENPIVVGLSVWAQVGVPETQAPVFSRLNQNVPNPFNPVTMIRFSVAEAGMVNLKVFDVSGRPVRALVEGWTEPRYYEVVWDGRDDKGNLLASGVYLYKLEAPGYVETRKMLLLK